MVAAYNEVVISVVRKIQVSNVQLFMVVIATVIAYGHFVYVGLSFRAAGKDAWVSLILGFAVSSLIFHLRIKQALLHPHQSLVEYTMYVFGRWFGGLLSIVYLVFFLCIGAFTLKEVTSFLGLMYPNTPVMIFVCIELILIGWAARAGGEVMTRVIQLLLPILVFMGFLVMIFSLKDKEPAKLLPIMTHPIPSILHGALMYVVIFSELILFSMFWKDARQMERLPKQSWITSLILFVMFIGPVTGPIMVFGEALCRLLPYPTYSEIQYIHLTGIFERMDVVGVFLWTMGSYMRVSVFTVGAVRVVADLVKSPNENLYSLPVTVVLGGITISLLSTSRETMHQFLYTVYPMIAVGIGVGIPLLTAVVAWGRNRMKFEAQST